MKRYALVVGALLAVMLVLFGIVEALGVPLLTDPSRWLSRAGPEAALIGVGLLVFDVFLPVPSSFVMVANGALFGMVPGMLLSLVGGLGAALVGFAIGRAGGPLLARLVSPEERARADRLLRRWGALAIVLSRPVPLLAETVAILAGTSPLGWGRMAAAALAGSLPPALIYALTGTVAADLPSAILMFVLVLLVTALFWWLGRRVDGGPTTGAA